MDDKKLQDKIIYEEKMGKFERCLLFAGGSLCFLAPFELLIQPKWQSFQAPFFFVALIISLGAIFVGLTFLFGAFFSYNSKVVVDPETEKIFITRSIPRLFKRKQVFSFDDVVKLIIETVDWDTRPETFRIIICLSKSIEISVGEFANKSLAETKLRQYSALMNIENDNI